MCGDIGFMVGVLNVIRMMGEAPCLEWSDTVKGPNFSIRPATPRPAVSLYRGSEVRPPIYHKCVSFTIVRYSPAAQRHYRQVYWIENFGEWLPESPKSTTT